MKEIQGKSILVRVSDGSSYRESTVMLCLKKSERNKIAITILLSYFNVFFEFIIFMFYFS